MADTRATRLAGHEVIICTRNRPADLSSALRAVIRGTSLLPILVVDSSDTTESEDEVSRARAEAGPEWQIRYLRSSPGLTRQRNAGLDNSKSDVVHFIDDDADVMPDYFSQVAQTFDANPDLVGVGGLQLGVPPRRPSRIRALLQLEAAPGRLSRSAVNNMITQESLEPVDVDWLSGCCMSFRTALAREVRFDESKSGYSLGEDVEFSLRMKQRGRLAINTRAKVNHKFSPIDRYAIAQTVRGTFLHRYDLVRRHPTRFSRSAFWVSVAADTANYTIRSLAGGRGSRQALRGLLSAVMSIGRDRRHRHV